MNSISSQLIVLANQQSLKFNKNNSVSEVEISDVLEQQQQHQHQHQHQQQQRQRQPQYHVHVQQPHLKSHTILSTTTTHQHLKVKNYLKWCCCYYCYHNYSFTSHALKKRKITSSTFRIHQQINPNIYLLIWLIMSLHKRQTTWHEIYAQTMQSQRLDWFNPCGGQYLNQRQVKKGRRPPLKKALRKLRNVTGREFKTLNITTPAIDMSDIRIWDLHQKNYGFLPKLKLNSSLHWDYHKTLQQSEVAKELNALKNSARNILCHLEIAINNTTTFNRIQSNLAILTFKRTTMEKKLKFQTPLKHISPALWKSNVAQQQQQQQHYRNERTYEVNPLDLKFTKSHYFNFLRKMIKILRINTKRKDKRVWQTRQILN
uniref:Uncharacterized protein n=1 Tax=Glossina palpalis gambiensis TaxID=67801 RepID=A0A1B0AUI3_9MUSC